MTVFAHLKERHLNIDLHRPVIDEADNVATFYLWNLSGQLIGYQQYRPHASKTQNNDLKDGRYFTHRSKELSTVTVWGVESMHLTPHLLFVTEGVFDAARLTEKGCSAIAVLSNNTADDLYNWLMSLNRTIVVVADNDAAGNELAKFGDVCVRPDAHDLGDASDKFVSELVARFTQ